MARIVHLTTLERIENLTSTVKSFFLRLPPGQKLAFKAGQFISVHVPRENKVIRKPYSIASSPLDPTLLEICIKRVEGGFVSNTFFSYREGITIPVDGPDGVFILRDPFQYDLSFIGAGTGIAPLRSMVQSLLHEGFSKRVCLIFGVRTENEILYEREFRALEKGHANFQFVPTLSRPLQWKGETGYVQEKIDTFIGNGEGKQAYVCGLPPMVDAVKEKLKSIGFDRKQIHYEKYV